MRINKRTKKRRGARAHNWRHQRAPARAHILVTLLIASRREPACPVFFCAHRNWRRRRVEVWSAIMQRLATAKRSHRTQRCCVPSKNCVARAHKQRKCNMESANAYRRARAHSLVRYETREKNLMSNSNAHCVCVCAQKHEKTARLKER